MSNFKNRKKEPIPTHLEVHAEIVETVEAWVVEINGAVHECPEALALEHELVRFNRIRLLVQVAGVAGRGSGGCSAGGGRNSTNEDASATRRKEKGIG